MRGTIEIMQGVANKTSNKPSRTARAFTKCRAAYMAAYDAEIRKGKQTATAWYAGKIAYKISMPQLETLEDIRAFIACVAQGLTLDVFNGRDGSQMLYAAQVALSLAKVKPIPVSSEESEDDAA